MLTEADTGRKFVVPKFQAAGWDNEPHSIAEQRTITDGRIVPVGKGSPRRRCPYARTGAAAPTEANWTH
jgi:type I restriction enzyme R subunit